MSTIQPRITVLDSGQIDQIHTHSLQILSDVGVRVDSESARRIFARAVEQPADDDGYVRIPPELVERALATAPSTVDVYDRRGNHAFRLGDGAEQPQPQAQPQARFGIGVTALYYQDPETDDVTPFARHHMAQMVKLGNALDSFDLVSTVGIVQDVAPELSDLYATLEMVANTVKPLSILISDEDRFPDVLDMIAHLHGDLASRPFVVPYFNPITPLVMNESTTDKIQVTIERKLPFMYSNYGMVGATTPITPASSLVLLNAELLAGLTFSQLVQEGTPVILGCLPAFFDMQGMGSFYDTQSYLINLACAEMMAHYRLPHCGTSGSGMGWGADLIASGHQWMNHLTSCMGKIGLAPFVGDNLDSKAFSPAVVVHANEIIAQARRLVQGFLLDEASIALPEIKQTGPGGNYLTSELTFEHFRDAYFRSDIWPNLTFEEWQEQSHPQPTHLLRRYTRDLLDRLTPPQDHADLMARGEAFIAQRRERI